MNTFLIIGGAGFIGSNLAEHLLNNNHKIIIFDNCSTGRIDNLEGLDVDFRDENIIQAMKDCDYIFHLAGSVGVANVNNDPMGAMTNNLKMEQTVFHINSYLKKPLLFASTSEVYGNSPDTPFREDAPLHIGSPDQGRWGYACSKLMGEFMAIHSNFPAVVVRFFNVTGEKQLPDYGMVLPKFIERGLKGDDIEIYGDGLAVRCFSYIGDVVHALETLITTEKCYNEIFNVGRADAITIKQLANMVITATDFKSKIVYKPFENVFSENPTDIRVRVPDVSKIKDFIGWEATTDISDIVRNVVRYESSRHKKT